jgi:hypothetical protein
MDEPIAGPDGDPSHARAGVRELPNVIDILPGGDVVLDVTFTTSKETLKSAKKLSQPGAGRTAVRPMLSARIRVGYRVHLAVLKRQSKYFNNLLGDSRFQEAKSIEAAFQNLSLRNIKPADADPNDLPWIRIADDDEATRSAGREDVFGDLLRILHGVYLAIKVPTMAYVTLLAVLADRFDCPSPVSRCLSMKMKFKWPTTQTKLPQGEDGIQLSRAAEETLRQKILVSWLLDQPMKMHMATRELILYGSSRWSAYPENDSNDATWWDLQYGLESKQVVSLAYALACLFVDRVGVQGNCDAGANAS